MCQNEGLGIIPWSPLRGGWLSGRYQRGMQAPPQGSRVEEAGQMGWSESWDKYNNEHTWGRWTRCRPPPRGWESTPPRWPCAG